MAVAAVQARGAAAVDQNATALAQRAVAFARSVIGVPYVWGGVTPNGFDCSGLCQWAYKMAGKDIPRTSSEQASAGYPKVAAGAWAPGDLIFSDWPGDAGPSPGHVVMYVGGGWCVAAPHTGTTVQMQPVSTFLGTPYRGAVRPSGSASGVPSLTGAAPAGAGSSSPLAATGAPGLAIGFGALVVVGALLVGGVAIIALWRHRRAEAAA